MSSQQVTSDAPVGVTTPAPRRRAWVLVACLTALGLFVGAFTLLYVAWLPRESPTAMVVVQGDESSVGVVVLVSPVDRSSPVRPLRAEITPRDDFRVRIHMPPGEYEILLQRNGRPMVPAQRGIAGKGQAIYLDISQPATRPTAPRGGG